MNQGWLRVDHCANCMMGTWDYITLSLLGGMFADCHNNPRFKIRTEKGNRTFLIPLL